MGEEQIVALLLRLKDTESKNKEFRFSKGYAEVESGKADAFRNAFFNADQMLYADKNSKKLEL